MYEFMCSEEDDLILKGKCIPQGPHINANITTSFKVLGEPTIVVAVMIYIPRKG